MPLEEPICVSVDLEKNEVIIYHSTNIWINMSIEEAETLSYELLMSADRLRGISRIARLIEFGEPNA